MKNTIIVISSTFLIISTASAQVNSTTSDETLINCLTTAEAIGEKQQCPCSIEEAYDELLARKPVDLLIRIFKKTKDDFQRKQTLDLLYHIDSQKVVKFMRNGLSSKPSEENYYRANYLAKRGDKQALSLLNKNWFKYPVSSLQWAATVELFGRYKYRPTIPNLIAALDAASLNLADAAIKSLQAMYPQAPQEFESISKAKEYFLNEYKQDNK